MQEMSIQSLGQEDPLEKEMAPHSSPIAWKIPWTEEPGRLQSMGSQSRTRLSNFVSLSFVTWCELQTVQSQGAERAPSARSSKPALETCSPHLSSWSLDTEVARIRILRSFASERGTVWEFRKVLSGRNAQVREKTN